MGVGWHLWWEAVKQRSRQAWTTVCSKTTSPLFQRHISKTYSATNLLATARSCRCQTKFHPFWNFSCFFSFSKSLKICTDQCFSLLQKQFVTQLRIMRFETWELFVTNPTFWEPLASPWLAVVRAILTRWLRCESTNKIPSCSTLTWDTKNECCFWCLFANIPVPKLECLAALYGAQWAPLTKETFNEFLRWKNFLPTNKNYLTQNETFSNGGGSKGQDKFHKISVQIWKVILSPKIAAAAKRSAFQGRIHREWQMKGWTPQHGRVHF